MTSRRNLFKKFFGLFFFSILALFFLNSAMLLYLSNRNLRSMSAKLYEKKAEGICQMLDDSLFSPLSNIVFNQFIYFQNSSVMNFLLYEDDDRYARELSTEIAKEVLSHEWLESIVVYREDGQVSTDLVTRRRINDTVQSVLLEGAINYISKEKSGSGWLAQGKGGIGPEMSLMYYVKYPMTNPARNRGGAIYIIDTAFLSKEITKLIDPSEESALIEDREGTILFKCGKEEIPRWIEGTKPERLQKASIWKSTGSDLQVVWQSLSDRRISLAMVTSSISFRRNLLYTQTLAFILAFLFIVVLGSYLVYVTRRVQNPLTRIMDSLVDILYRGDPSPPRMKSCLLETDRIVEENRSLIKYRFVIDMITGGLERSEFSEICEILGLMYFWNPLFLILVEQDPSLIKGLSWDERELRRDALQKLWDELLPAERSISIRYPAGSLVCLFFPKPGEELPATDLRAFAERTRSNVAYSIPLAMTLDLPKAYALLIGALDQKLSRGYGNLFPPEEKRPLRPSVFSVDLLRKLLMGDQYGDFLAMMAEDIGKLGDEGSPPLIIRDYFIRIVELIDEVYQKKSKGKDDAEFSHLSMREELQELSTLSEIEGWIGDKIGMLKESVQYSREAGHRELYEKIRDYIHLSPGENTTQTTVAERFGISSGFLSRLFREFSPEGFNTYLKECKLEEAAKRIREGSGTSVADLAKTLGYSSAVYFSRQFKERFGLSPHEYARRVENSRE